MISKLVNQVKRFFSGDEEVLEEVQVERTVRPTSRFEVMSSDCDHPNGAHEGVPDCPGVIRCGRCGAVL